MLKDIRTRRGISQSELAKLTGISINTIQGYEKINHRTIDGAKLDTLIDLSVALGCPIRDLLDSEKLKKKCDTTEL